MKVGIICFWDRTATPYLQKYERVLNELNIDYDVIFWNRTGMKSNQLGAKEREVVLNCGTKMWHKIISFVLWRNSILKVLREEKYDFLIILSTYPAVLISGYLFKHYNQRYLLDIRDYSLENISFFGKIVTALVDKSAFCTISSKGFMRWLKPSPKIVPNHNITSCQNNYEKNIRIKMNVKLNFTFVGNVRLDKQTEAVLVKLSRSKKYISGFVGRILPSCNIVDFCRKNDITNLYFLGQFDNQDKPRIYQNVDIINAIYANDDKNIRLADATPLPNRVYDAAVYKCPIVASKGTYLADLIQEYSLGFSVNGFDDDIEEQFDIFVRNFDEEVFRKGCERFLLKVLAEEKQFTDKLKNTLEFFDRRTL